jgi:hypothetical protein
MTAGSEDAVSVIAGAIRRYAARHPEAADTAAGVQRWWLPTQLHEEPLPLVCAALERLVGEGVMRRTELEDGTVIYANVRRPAP